MGTPAGNSSRLCGYETAFNEQRHVIFVDANAHVGELVYADRWYYNDLSSQAKAPTPAPPSPLVGYVTGFNQQQHVIYLTPDEHIHELVYGSYWSHNNLTSLASAPTTVAASALAGYVTDFNQQQHVIYLTSDGHVHELVYGGGWSHNDLTGLTGAPAAVAGSPLAGYATDFNKQQHVYFIAADHHVHQLVYGGAWTHDDPSDLTSAMDAAPGTALAGFQTADNQQQHAVYIGTDKHVRELVYWGSKWYTDDLTKRAGAVNAAAGRLVGFSQSGAYQHVLYVGTDGHIHGLTYLPKPNKWVDTDWTANSKAVAPIAGSALAGYQSTYETSGGYTYAMYLGPQNHVWEVVQSTTPTDLTAST